MFFEYAKTAEEKGFKVIIAGAGMAAHLPGMCAAIFPMPVIGIPVTTVAINGGANAGLLAAKILATSDENLLNRLKDYTREKYAEWVVNGNIEEDWDSYLAELESYGVNDYVKIHTDAYNRMLSETGN